MNHPTFADNAFTALLDRRLFERFPKPADVVGEEVPQIIAEAFRVWLADPATRATHHPLELRELEEIMLIQRGITPGTRASGRALASRPFPARDAATHISITAGNSALPATGGKT